MSQFENFCCGFKLPNKFFSFIAFATVTGLWDRDSWGSSEPETDCCEAV